MNVCYTVITFLVLKYNTDIYKITQNLNVQQIYNKHVTVAN